LWGAWALLFVFFVQDYQPFLELSNIFLGLLCKHLLSTQQFLVFLLCFYHQVVPACLQIERLIHQTWVHCLFVHLQGSEFFDNVADPELHHHAHRLNFCDLVQQCFQFFNVGWVFLKGVVKVIDELFGSLQIFESQFFDDSSVPFDPAVGLRFEGVDDGFESHGEEEGDFLLGHVFVGLSFEFVGVHFGFEVLEGDGRVFVFKFFDGKFVFGVPHGILFVGVFGFGVGFEHLFEFSGSVVGFGDAHTDEELDFDDDVVLLDIIFEGMFLHNLIIGSFGGFTELTRAIHPPPEVFSRRYDIVRNVVQTLDQLSRGRGRRKVRVFVVGLDLEEGVALSSRVVDGLVDQRLERQQRP
jgi:hypothetical protein